MKHEDFDQIFSLYIRIKYTDDNYIGKCYTCGKICTINKLQNGHYVSRSVNRSLIFNLDNCRPQCVACNIFKEGNKSAFRINLENEIGKHRVDNLELWSKIKAKATQPVELMIKAKQYVKEMQEIIRQRKPNEFVNEKFTAAVKLLNKYCGKHNA